MTFIIIIIIVIMIIIIITIVTIVSMIYHKSRLRRWISSYLIASYLISVRLRSRLSYLRCVTLGRPVDIRHVPVFPTLPTNPAAHAFLYQHILAQRQI